MKLESILIHPAIAVATLPAAVGLWSLGGIEVGWGITTDWWAVAFSCWTILVLLNLVVKIPKAAFAIGALFFTFMGTFTLAEATIGYGYLLGGLLNRKEKHDS